VSKGSFLYASLNDLEAVENTTLLATVSTGSKLVTATNLPVLVTASGVSTIKLRGSVAGGSLSTGSSLHVQGSILNEVSVSGMSSVNTDDGNSCKNVTLNQDLLDRCTVSNVNVTVEILPLTRDGSYGDPNGSMIAITLTSIWTSIMLLLSLELEGF